MSRDPELDRLKTAQDRAFDRKQTAYAAMDAAGKRFSEICDAADRAYQAKQRACETQNSAWQDLQWTRDRNGPRIDSLNSQQGAAYERMKDAFERASSAYQARDGASARTYADQGHSYKQEAQDCVAERRRLVQEIRDARDRHEATKPAFEQAKSKFEHWRSKRDRARQVHQDRIKEFQQAKAEYDKARDAFRARLEVVRAKRERRRQDNRTVAERAGVPSMYLDDVWVSYEPGGTANIYFGGVGKPNGPGHGHYVMTASGEVTYRRDPFDPHGAENFVDDGRGNPNDDRARRSGRAAEGLVTAAFGVFGALINPGMAASALPGHEGDAQSFGTGWKDSSRTEQRNSQARVMRRATRDKGVRDGGTSQQD